MAKTVLISLLILLFSKSVSSACPRDPLTEKICAGYGECNVYNQCICDSQHSGFDCSRHECPKGLAWSGHASATDTIHELATCSNRGTCDYTSGKCSCDSGFTGSACQRTECLNDCSNNGQCVSMKTLSSHNRYGLTAYSYESIWDAEKIYGCQCEHGYTGADCSEMVCPTGDDPLTIGEVNEVQLLKCDADTGSFVLYFEGQYVTIAADLTTSEFQETIGSSFAALGRGVEVTFSQGSTVCRSTTPLNIISIEFVQNFGPQLPLKVFYTTSNGISTLTGGSGIVQVATAGETFDGIQSITGTKDGAVCSNRGTCDTRTGECSCFTYPLPGFRSSDGYGNAGTRGDCGAADDHNPIVGTVSACPGEVTCSGHGYCSGTPTFTCQCEVGWTAGDCSERTCPTGRSWFHNPTEADDTGHNVLTECSSGGKCDKSSGECECVAPFFGPACEHMECPNSCSGHGVCMNLVHLASTSTAADGSAGGFTYGADSNNPHTWDGEKILSCDCDDGYTGHACQLKTCPTGDDPSTTDGQVDEVQVLQCFATTGTFKLKFRQALTASIAFDASAEEVEAALEAVNTVDDVTVEYSDGAVVACSDQVDSTHFISVTFLINHGDLPPLSAVTSSLTNVNTVGQITVTTDGNVAGPYTTVRGTKEDVTCSNKGTCDTETGLCECGSGYGSSDGRGGEGRRGDCGYRLPYGRNFRGY